MGMRVAVLSVLAPVLLTGHLPRQGVARQVQTPTTMVKRIGSKTLVRVAANGRTVDTIYRSTGFEVLDLAVAPTGRYVSVRERRNGKSYSTRLVVLSASGGVVRVVDRDVRPHVWCCGGAEIALIVGQYAEDEVGFSPAGAYLVNVDRGTERRLDLPQDVYDVTWASFDGALYFKTTRGYPGSSVVRYDPRTGETRLTHYRDLRFSPSGAFYLHYFPDVRFGPPGPHLFQRETGREVPLPDRSLGAVEGWVFDEGDYLQLKRASYPERHGMLRGREVVEGYTIYDVRRQVVAARIPDAIRGDVVVPAGAMVLPADGGLKVVRRPSDIGR